MAVALARLAARAAKKKPKAKAGKKKGRGRPKKSRAASRKANRLAKSVKRAPVKYKIPRGKRAAIEATLTDQFGPAPKGINWSMLYERYDRFQEYANDALAEEE